MRTGTEISRPRGRPRSFDRDTVLRAAGQRFRTHGFAATSLDDLADATGVNRPSLYAAFGDKRAFYLAALERTEAWLAESFAGLRQANLPARKAVERMLRFSIDTYLSGEQGPSGCIALNTATAEAVTDPEIRAALARILALEDREIEALLEQGGSPAPRAHAAIVAGVLHSLSIRARAGESKEKMLAIAMDCAALIPD
ncbi:MAG: TetR/AcrR family transcriptional regulator [Pseudomonadota bacterium]